MKTTAEVAQQLVHNCENPVQREGMSDLYHPDCVSVEAMAPPGSSPEYKGVAAIKAKHEWWEANFEVHSTSADGPYINGDRFSVIFGMDVTEKASGERTQMQEVALYEVRDGQIVREEFQMKPMG
ncbi:MAG: nuclear transport factor 2 family protein [Pseudomonadota bacterium]